MGGYVEIQGLKELHRALRRATDQELPKRMGQANKEVGRQLIDRWLFPRPTSAAVGEGAGAAVRPSATKREVVLRVGGRHRSGLDDKGKPLSPRMQWGRRLGRDIRRRAPERPHIRGSVDRHYDDIAALWLEAIEAALQPPFDGR